MQTAKATGPFSKRQVRAARFLSKHHTASQNPKLALMTDTTPWYCGTCQKKNSYRAEYCDQCGASWMWSSQSSSSWGNGHWQDAPRTPRRRSQSRSRGKGKGQAQGQGGKGKNKGKGKAEEYHGTLGTTPWQSSSSALQSLGVTLPAMEQKVQQTPAPKQVEGVISGLRTHLRSLGQETTPEVESYLPKCLGNGPQGKNSCQVESRALPIGHPMAKVPKEGRGRVQAPEAEVLGKTKTAARRLDTSRRRVQCSTASTSRGGSSNGYTKWRRACTTQANRRGRSRTAVGRDRDSTKTEAGSCPCGRRSGPEEVEVPDQDPGFSQLHEQDGFLIGRHGSCYNVHAKRPRFFCLVEAAIIDDDSAPVEVGNTPTTWWDLASTLPAQTIPPPSTPPYCKHEYGPRQAEYVAQLMRYEVETNQFPEAFDDCLWDETLISLQHLDRIEQTEMFEAAFSGHQPKDVVRQIEGSTLWTLLAL